MSFKTYRLLDLAIFSVLFFIFEFLSQMAATQWFVGQPFSVSLLLPLLLLIIMRWDYYSIPLLVIFGAYFVLIYNRPGEWYQYLIYIIGNLGLIITIVLIKKIGKDKIRNKVVYTILYVVGSYIFLEGFRSIGALIFAHYNIVDIFREFFFTDLLNLVFALIIILICRNVNGLFEDQKSYLIKQSKNNN